MRAAVTLLFFVFTAALARDAAQADGKKPVCHALPCPTAEVGRGSVDVSARDVSTPDTAGVRRASNESAAGSVLFHWRLQPACTEADAATGNEHTERVAAMAAAQGAGRGAPARRAAGSPGAAAV